MWVTVLLVIVGTPANAAVATLSSTSVPTPDASVFTVALNVTVAVSPGAMP